jgi:hypothetical protein
LVLSFRVHRGRGKERREREQPAESVVVVLRGAVA